jgi:hypothetical protein
MEEEFYQTEYIQVIWINRTMSHLRSVRLVQSVRRGEAGVVGRSFIYDRVILHTLLYH